MESTDINIYKRTHANCFKLIEFLIRCSYIITRYNAKVTHKLRPYRTRISKSICGIVNVNTILLEINNQLEYHTNNLIHSVTVLQ